LGKVLNVLWGLLFSRAYTLEVYGGVTVYNLSQILVNFGFLPRVLYYESYILDYFTTSPDTGKRYKELPFCGSRKALMAYVKFRFLNKFPNVPIADGRGCNRHPNPFHKYPKHSILLLSAYCFTTSF
jgi:hypothetical protein